MNQIDRLEDISAMRSSTIRFLVSTVSGHNLPSTTAALEELSTQSVALHRYILRNVLSSTFTALKVLSLSSSTEDEVVLHTNYTVASKDEVDGANPSGSPARSRPKKSVEALIQLSRSLVLSALHKPNAITLIGGSLDFLAPVPTPSPTFSSSVTSSPNSRFMANSLSSPLTPSSPLTATVSERITLSPMALHSFLQHTLQLSNLQIFLFAGALSVASAVPSVKEAAISVALKLEALPAGASERKDDSMLRSLTFLLKISSSPSTSPASGFFSSARAGEETNSSSPPPLTKAFETQLEQFLHSGNSTALSSSTAVPGVSLVSLTPSLFSSVGSAAVSPLPFSASTPLPTGVSSTPLDRFLSPTSGVEAGDARGSRSPSVSIGAILREVGTGCVTTTAESKELLRLLGKKITEADIAEVLGFFASSAMTNVNDASAYRMLSAIFSSTPDAMDSEGTVEATVQGRGGMNGNLSSISATTTNTSISMSNGGNTNGPSSVGMMMTSGGSAGVVNARPLLLAMHASGNSYDWEEVIRLLDVPDEDGFEPSTISLIFDAYHSFHKKPLPPSATGKSTSVDTTEFTSRTNNSTETSGGGEYPPITLFLGAWKNTKRQRSAIMYILQNPEKCNMKVLEEEMASDTTHKGERGPIFLSPAFAEALKEDQNTSGSAASPPGGASPSSPNRGPTSTLNNSSSGNANSSPAFSTSLLSSPLAALHLWGSSSFMEAALHVASRETRFDEDVLQPAVRAAPLLFAYVLFGLPQLKYSLKGIAVLKKILADPLWRPSLERMTTFILPQAERSGNLSAWINLLSELTISQPNTTVSVLEMILHVKPPQHVLQTSSSPRLVVGVAMCMDEAAKRASSAGPVANGGSSQSAIVKAAPGQNEPWLQRALEGHLHFSASSTENRFVVAMYVVEIAEMLLSKSRFIESATTALHALLNTPLKDMLPQIAESARVLLASVDYLFEPEIEKAATAVFLEMYESGTVETAIERVRALRDSSETRHKQIYACVIHIMFDEIASLSLYPSKELKLFAQLFGRLMADNLLNPSQATRAWALLLPAIIKPPDAASEEYGIFALKEIKPRLAEWPQYCRALRQVKDLDFRVPGVMATIYRGIKEEVQATSAANAAAAAAATGGAEAGEGESTSLSGAGGTLRKPLFADPAILSSSSPPGATDEVKSDVQLHTLNIKALLADESITSPPPVIQDQINFLVGNTDAKNLHRHAEEMALQLRPEYYEYFAHYLVVKRAALEPNNHALYSELIQRLQIKELKAATRIATVSAVKRLLSSPKVSSSVADEWILLGNLGLWLGGITLRQDIPLLTVDLNFEALLADGLRNQRLAAATTLMSRVLESCSKSTLFAPPNSWTMSQLSLFLQVAEFPCIKPRICIELDILLTKLKLHMADLKVFAENFQQSRRRLRQPPLLPKAFESLDRTQPHSDFTELLPPHRAVIAANEPHSVGGSATASRGPSPSPDGAGTSSTRSASQRSSNLQRTAEPFHLSRNPSSSGSPQGVDAFPRSLGGGAPTNGAVNGQVALPLGGTAPLEGLPAGVPLSAIASMGEAATDSFRSSLAPPPVAASTSDGRPRIELTLQRIQIPQAVRLCIPLPEEFKEQLFKSLQLELGGSFEERLNEIADHAAECTDQLFKKEGRQLRNPSAKGELREATVFMVRSLAANDCFISFQSKVAEIIRMKMEDLLLQQLRTPSQNQKAILYEFMNSPTIQPPEIIDNIMRKFRKEGEPFFTECENLFLRVLEYRAGEYAVKALLGMSMRIPDSISQGQTVPPTRQAVLQSFRDFFYRFPAANGFMHALRKVENMLNRGMPPYENTTTNGLISGGGILPSPESPAETPSENGGNPGTSPSSGELSLQEQPTLSAEKKTFENLITYESAVYIAGPMVLRLFATARMDEDRAKESVTTKGKSSAATSTVTSKNGSVGSTAPGPSATHEAAPGANSVPDAQSPQEQWTTAAASSALGNDPKGRPDSSSAGTVPSVSPAVSADVIAAEAARPKKVSQMLWQLYLDILVTCLERNECVVREEVSTVFLQQDGRFAYGNVVMDLLRHNLINPARLDENLVAVFSQPSCRASVSGLVARIIQSDRVLVPSQLKNILQAMHEVTAQCGPPLLRASPLLLKPLIHLARRDVQKLILPLDLLCESEEAYLEISRELDNWIVLKHKSRVGSSGGKQSSSSGSSGTNPSSENRAEGATTGDPAGAGGKAGSSSLPSEKTSTKEEPLDFSFVRELIKKQYVSNAHIVPFFHSMICICVEDHATCTLRHEQRAMSNDRSVTLPAITAASSAGTPLLNPDTWSPPKAQSPYDPTVFMKCDYFVDLCSVLLRCACVRQYDTKNDTRGDVTVLRRVLDSVVRVLRKHHASEAMLEKWNPPKFRVPLPLNVAYVPIFMQQPYVRILSNLLLHIQNFKPDAALTMPFLDVLHYISPLELPGFAFGWLEIVSHRILLQRTLKECHEELWESYALLLADALRFISVNTHNQFRRPGTVLFFKAFTKLIMVIHHDFPHFLLAQNYFLYSVTAPQYLHLLNLYNVRAKRHREVGKTSSSASSPSSVSSSSSGTAATSGEERGGGGETDNDVSSSGGSSRNPPGNNTIVNPPVYPFLPIEAVMKDLESSNIGFERNLELLEAWTAALVAQASRNREMFRERPSAWASKGDSPDVLTGNPVVVPGNSVKNAFLTRELLKVLVNHIRIINSPRILHALSVQAFFITTGISVPQLRWAAVHQSDGENDATVLPRESKWKPDEERIKRYKELVWESATVMPPKVPPQLLCVDPPSPVLLFFRYLSDNLDIPRRYYLFHACAHHLRAEDSAETAFFAEVFTYLFTSSPLPRGNANSDLPSSSSGSNGSGAFTDMGTDMNNNSAAQAGAAHRLQTIIQEQILRTLLERALTYLPRPPGLTSTLRSLINLEEFKSLECSDEFFKVLNKFYSVRSAQQ